MLVTKTSIFGFRHIFSHWKHVIKSGKGWKGRIVFKNKVVEIPCYEMNPSGSDFAMDISMNAFTCFSPLYLLKKTSYAEQWKNHSSPVLFLQWSCVYFRLRKVILSVITFIFTVSLCQDSLKWGGRPTQACYPDHTVVGEIFFLHRRWEQRKYWW